MNYTIENGLNFYETLKQSIASHDAENNKQAEEICPISNTPLESHFFTFECGHKFNYAPLFKDLYNHKKKYNHMENGKGQLNMNEIRCPFCRKKQSGLLPYYPELSFEKVHGVNYINPGITEYVHGSSFTKCSFIITPESEETGPAVKCQSVGNIITSEFCFCYPHYIQYKQIERQKIKAIKDAANALVKAAEKEAKLVAKAAEKEAKLAAKTAEKEAKLAAKTAEKEAKIAAKTAEKAAKTAEKEAAKSATKK